MYTFVLGVLPIALAVGCNTGSGMDGNPPGPNPGGSTPVGATFSQNVQPIVNARWTGCHSPQQRSGSLDLSASVSKENALRARGKIADADLPRFRRPSMVDLASHIKQALRPGRERPGQGDAATAGHAQERTMIAYELHFGVVCVAALGLSAISACATSAPAAKGKAWETMDRATLDLAYNNSKAVPESGAMFKEWVARCQEVRSRHSDHLDLAYGPGPRNRIDYFSAGQNTPVLVFIHGGFWQMRSKEDFAFLAESFLQSGISVAMVGYPLGPDASMDEIVADTHTAIRYLATRLPELRGDPRRVIVSGWSSGGHLAAMVLEEPLLRGGVAISGIYELEPLVNSYVNDKLHMEVGMARRNSPTLLLPNSSKQIDLFAGGAELAEMRRQTADYASARRTAGLPVRYVEIPDANHYTILNRMMNRDGEIHQAIVAMVGGR